MPSRHQPQLRPRRFVGRAIWPPGLAAALGSLISGSVGSIGLAQVGGFDVSPSMPRLPFSNPAPVKYNLKWGRLTARITGSAVTEFNDNINLSAHDPQSDFSIGPQLGVGFLWPITKLNVMHLDVGVGYTWYLHNPSINSMTMAPSSRFEHNVYLEKVRFNFHDNIAIQTDPVSTHPEIGGNNQSVTSFRRLNNQSGVDADWRPYKKVSLAGGYDFMLDRTLTSQFASLDHNDHNFHGSANYLMTPRISVGAFGAYTISQFLEHLQNDGTSSSYGPTISLKATRLITVSASAGYTVSTFEPTGTLADHSDFRGVTYQVGVQQTLNSRVSHAVRLSRMAALAYGANFSDTVALQYDWTGRLSRAVSLNASFAYETFQTSGLGGEDANQYLFHLGTAYQLTRRWNMGLGYSFSWKVSNKPDNDYAQNRVTLTVTRQF